MEEMRSDIVNVLSILGTFTGIGIGTYLIWQGRETYEKTLNSQVEEIRKIHFYNPFNFKAIKGGIIGYRVNTEEGKAYFYSKTKRGISETQAANYGFDVSGRRVAWIDSPRHRELRQVEGEDLGPLEKEIPTYRAFEEEFISERKKRLSEESRETLEDYLKSLSKEL